MDVRPYSEHWPSKRRLFNEADSAPSMGVSPMLDLRSIAQAMAQAEVAIKSFFGSLEEYIATDIAAGILPFHPERQRPPRRNARRAHRRALKRGRR